MTIEEIKNLISIVDLANRYGAQPQREDGEGAVHCKANPLRSEKTSSLFIYPKTNSFNDFGDDDISGSIIDWIMIADGVSPSDAINTIKYMAGISREDDNYQAPAITPQQPVKKSYLHDHESVTAIWSKFSPLDKKKHKAELDAIAPEYVFTQCDIDDKKEFSRVAKYDNHSNTLAVLVSENGKNVSLRHRRLSIGGDIKKWVALKDAKASVPYIRDKKDEIILIVEGSHDYLTAILCGFSVIGLPQAGFKLEAKYLQNRRALFIADDDEAGREGMEKTITFSGGEGLRFNHKKFQEDNNVKPCKDFSDYLHEFTSLVEFQKAIALHIETLHATSQNIADVLRNIGGYVTKELLASMKAIDIMIDDVLPRSQITTIVGKPNVGKSALTLSIINKLLTEDKIDNMIYFDPDNPLIYSGVRVNKLTDNHSGKGVFYYSGSSTSKKEMHSILETLAVKKGGGERTVVVIDSLKNFISGSINDDKVINPLFDTLQSIRDNFKATIIVLHHTKKGKDEDGKLGYVGSQVIEASTDNMFLVGRTDDTVHLEASKMRAMLSNKAFKIHFEDMEIVETEYKEIVESGNDDDISKDVYNFIENNPESTKQDIVKNLKQHPSRKISDILFDKDNIGKLWTYRRDKSAYLFKAVKKDKPIEFVETEFLYDDTGMVLF